VIIVAAIVVGLVVIIRTHLARLAAIEAERPIQVAGTVEPANTVDLSFGIGGPVVKVTKIIGDRVSAGEVIAEVSNGALKAKYNQAAALVASQKAKLADLESGTDTAAINLIEAQISKDNDAVSSDTTDLGAILTEDYSVADDSIHDKVDDFFTSPYTANPQLAFTDTDPSASTLESGRAEVEDRLADLQNLASTTAASIASFASVNQADNNFDNNSDSNPENNPDSSPNSGPASTSAANVSGTISSTISPTISATVSSASTAASTISATSNSVNDDLAEIKLFLDNVALTINALTPGGSGVSQATIDTWKSDLSTARTNVDDSITATLAADDKLQNAEDTLTVDQQQLSADQNANVATAIASQKTAVSEAEAALAKVNAELAATYIISPIDGLVTRQDARLGQNAPANTTLVSIASDSKYQIATVVPASDASRITVGENANVELDAYGPNVVFGAVVVGISPTETAGQETTTLQFEASDDRIKSGMTAAITISSSSTR
jgi:multidrug resistance efflux pump